MEPSAHVSPPGGGREALWKRLEALVEKSERGGLSRLEDEEIEAFGKLYRAAATQLALLKAFGASRRLFFRVNSLVSRAHTLLYAKPRRGANLQVVLWSFLAFPETVRRTAPYHLAAAAILLLGGLYGYAGAARDPEWTLELVPRGDTRTPYAPREELRRTLLEGRPGTATGDAGGSPRPHQEVGGAEKTLFAAILWRQNTTVAITAFFAGLVFAVPTVLLLLVNGVLLGVYTHTFHCHGLAYEWWAWILPHGVTELLAVTLLSGGGLYLGRQLALPGEVSRLDRLHEARPHAVRLLLFAFPMLLLAALVESFVRQSGLSDGARYVFAALSALFWTVYLGVGRVPRSLRERREEERTAAERAVPLPVEEELLAGYPAIHPSTSSARRS